MRLHHVGIRVKDLDQSRWFYSEILGLPHLQTSSLSPQISEALFGEKLPAQMETFGVEGGVIEIFYLEGKFQVNLDPRRPGINHFALEVNDRKEFCRQMEQWGVEAITLNRNGHLVYFLKDPDGILIEIRDRLPSPC